MKKAKKMEMKRAHTHTHWIECVNAINASSIKNEIDNEDAAATAAVIVVIDRQKMCV